MMCLAIKCFRDCAPTGIALSRESLVRCADEGRCQLRESLFRLPRSPFAGSPKQAIVVNPSENPEWLRQLAESVAALMHAHDVLSPVGCHVHQEGGLFEVMVFASRTEVFGGRQDGKRIPSRFTLDVRGLLGLFSSVESVNWQPIAESTDDEIGAHLAIVGDYQDRKICLRVPAEAPERFEVGRIANIPERRFINIW